MITVIQNGVEAICLPKCSFDSLILPRVGEYFSYSEYPTSRNNSEPSFRYEGIVKEIEHKICYNYESHKYHQYIYIVISEAEKQ